MVCSGSAATPRRSAWQAAEGGRRKRSRPESEHSELRRDTARSPSTITGLNPEAREARRCVVCDDAGDVVVTIESVGRRRGADVFFWDADDPPRERDREFFPSASWH